MAGKAVIISGPTASGKTSLVHQLWKSGDIIINADSRQIYKYFNIGTAKPCREDLSFYDYRLIDFLEPEENYTAHHYLEDCLKQIAGHDGRVFIAGGTPFYLDVLEYGLPEHEEIPSRVREDLEGVLENEGLNVLLAELQAADPEYYNQVDRSNPRRILRALEVIRSTGRPFTEFRSSRQSPGLELLKIILCLPRTELFERINSRVDAMLETGLLDEVKGLRGKYSDTRAMTGIGYSEWVDHFEGHTAVQDVLDKIKKNTRVFAKQQLTWFKRTSDCLFAAKGSEGLEAWFYDTMAVNSENVKITRNGIEGQCRIASEDGLTDKISKMVDQFYEH